MGFIRISFPVQLLINRPVLPVEVLFTDMFNVSVGKSELKNNKKSDIIQQEVWVASWNHVECEKLPLHLLNTLRRYSNSLPAGR